MLNPSPTGSTPLRPWGPLFRQHLGIPMLLLCYFLFVALWSLLPVLREFSSCVPAPVSGVRTVPLFNVWTIIWNSQQFQRGFDGYWDAPVFFPERRAFAFSEPQPATLLLAPLHPHKRTPALALNLWLVISLTLNGLFTVRLLRILCVPMLFATAAGTAMVLHPLVHDQLDSAQLVPLWPSLWTLAALVKLRQCSCVPETTLRAVSARGLEVGIAFCWTAACALHHALFLGLLLLLTGWTLIPFQSLRRWLPGAVAAGIICLSLIPAANVIRSVLKGPDFVREESLVTQLSVSPLDFARTSANAQLNLPALRGGSFFPMNPGWIRLAAALLACIGCYVGRCSLTADQRAAMRFLIAFTVVAALLCMGPRLQPGSWRIWSFLADWLPGFAQVRSPFRFGYFFQAGLLLLSAIGGCVCCRLRVLQNHAWFRKLLTVLLVVIISFEVLPGQLQLAGVPDLARPLDWIEEVQSQLPAGHGLLILPAAPTSNAAAFEETVRWMIRCTASGIPIVNGYSGFFPAAHYQLLQRLQKPWSGQLALELQRQHVAFVLAAESGVAKQLSETQDSGLEPIWQSDRSGAALFRINFREAP
ncbi:MAG: hypothetical protein ACKO2L_20740 [Planctomycetaceae bacterium]